MLIYSLSRSYFWIMFKIYKWKNFHQLLMEIIHSLTEFTAQIFSPSTKGDKGAYFSWPLQFIPLRAIYIYCNLHLTPKYFIWATIIIFQFYFLLDLWLWKHTAKAGRDTCCTCYASLVTSRPSEVVVLSTEIYKGHTEVKYFKRLFTC